MEQHLSTFSALIITLVAMLMSGFFSGMEIAFVSSNKVRLGIDVAKGGLANRIISIFYTHRDTFISTLLVGNNIVNVVYAIGFTALLEKVFLNWFGSQTATLIAITISSTLIILIVSEFLPKAVFRINPNSSLRAFSLPLLMCYCVLYPVSKFTTWLSRLIMRLFGVKETKQNLDMITVDELDDYLQENIDKREDENKTVEREVKIFENALDFSDTKLRDCMIPRNENVAVEIAETTRDDLIGLFSKSGLSKLVVYHDDIDNVLGFIQVGELFVADVNWKDRIKPVLFAPEAMLAKKMMQSLLKEKRSMAIVVDEFGGTSGMVTLEDLVEEIFGDIEDEHDRKRKKLIARQIDERTFEFAGRVEIARINEDFDIDLPENDDYQTIAGLIFTRMGAIPNEGEHLDLDDCTLTIVKKTGAKLDLVRLVKKEEKEPDKK